MMYNKFLNICIFGWMTFSVCNTNALVGISELTNSLYHKNQEIIALKNHVDANESLADAANSAYYPTLNAVGGYVQNKTDDLPSVQKGYLGYIEGKLNVFNGFKDQSVVDQKNIEFEISKIEFELKKHEITRELTDVLSHMILLHKLQIILDDEYKITQTQKQMAAKKVSAGLTGTIDNIEFELRENEIQIEQKQIYQQHQEVHQKLIKLFGYDINDSDLEKIDFSAASDLSKTPGQMDVNHNLNYKKALFVQTKAESEKSKIKSEFLPTLDLTYSMGRVNPSEEMPLKLNESKYAIQLTIPLFSGFNTYNKAKSAALSVQSAERIKTQKTNDINSDFNILKRKISELSELYQINEKKQINSGKYFDLTLAEYRRGIKNSPDLVTATERLFSAKKKKYEILKDLEIAKIQIEHLIN